MSDLMIDALRRLVANEGGEIAVADEIGVNDQSLYQILSGVLLPSGNPKGVGPRLRKKLTARYPGWLDKPPKTTASTDKEPLSVAPPDLAELLVDALGAMPIARWPSVRAQLDQLAANPSMRDDVLPELRALLQPPPAKRSSAS